MLHHEKKHVLSLRDLRVGSNRRAHLNVPELLKLIHAQYTVYNSRSIAPYGTHKKRRAPTPSNDGSRKRGRSRKDSEPLPRPGNDGRASSNDEESRCFPVYRHCCTLLYTTSTNETQDSVDEDDAEALGWIQEETSFKAQLKKLQKASTDPVLLDLGELLMVANAGAPALRSTTLNSTDVLLTLPRTELHINSDDRDLRWASIEDPLLACRHLSQHGRAEMSISLKLEVLSSRTVADALPFRLHLDIVVSLISPAIFAPIYHSSKGASAEVEEAQRRFLSYLFPDRPPPDAFHGNIDIPLLYSALGPAPTSYVGLPDASIQPPELVPTLLPFQRRSVAWMLGREGKIVSDDGEVISASRRETDTLPLFWQRVNISDGVSWYFHRLTGRISADRPKDDNAKALGGILAEEPGLGKTLECIALIMLNPSIGRSPKTKTWDPQAKIYVKEIKTTLIVTPPVLAPQWADELAAHAPGLKVLLYEGWSKVPVPISEAEVEEAREVQARAKRRLKARAVRAKAAAAKSKSKSAVAPRKGKAKQTPDDDVEMAETDEVSEEEDEQEDEIVDWCTYVNRFDVCITTYSVLQHDLSFARPPPVRPRRAGVVYNNTDRSRSPLVMCEWYRVIMDEVQMVGGGKTEEMVSLIPRLSSFAVSGTPARAQVADLIHVLKFLRVKDVLDSPRSWTRLLKPAYANQFIALFQKYAVRTTKNAVKDELTIPRQTRFLLPIELGKIERHVYDHNLEQAFLELGLDARGIAVSDSWEVDTTVLRTWLRKLRGICTHPQVGKLQSQADRLHKPGVLKSIGEVLEDMREKNWRNMMEDWRNKIQALTLLAQLKQQDNNDRIKYRSALDLLILAETEANHAIAVVQSAIKEHDAVGKSLKAKTADARKEVEPSAGSHLDKGKSRGQDREDSPLTEMSDEDNDLPKNAIGEEYAHKRRALHQRLRECQISLHKVHFLKGDVYHALGESYAKSEDEAYFAAETLRRLLLSGTEDAARRAMTRLLLETEDGGLSEAELQIEVPYCGKGGIRSADLMEEANDMIDEVLNEQGKLIWQWRSHLVSLLTQSLTSADGADGQEYTRSLDTQGEAETYLQNYTTLLADRRQALTTERTLLATHEGKEIKTRNTKAAAKATATAMDEDVIEKVGDIVFEAQPQNQVIHMELSSARKAILEEFDSDRALRSVMVDLNNIAAGVAREQDMEKILAREAATQLRGLLNEQMKLFEKLQGDCALLRRAFNDRVSYFRQLQELSDTVTEAEWEGSLLDAMNRVEHERGELDVKINAGKARQRYLDHLAKAQGDGALDEDGECCILCKCEFTRGYITQCAHVYCESCIQAWLERKEGKACPVCRVPINPDQLQRFAVAGIESKAPVIAPPKIVNNEPTSRSKRVIDYNMASDSLLESIAMMESHGSFGSKIQTLVRHLLYLNIFDPGCKTIVFSAWADSLHIIFYALLQNGIKALRGDQNSGKRNAAKIFRTDPSYSVLLLHGERENAGLNVTCASRVILVESVVNHAFEVQAIARIDRMGQTKPTEVYCYYTEDTVEKNILDLAAKQGQSLYTKGNSAGTLDVNPLTTAPVDKAQVDAPTKAPLKGDFVFKTNDMLAIFFPHLFEDVEYLLSPENLAIETNGIEEDSGGAGGSEKGIRFENAVAGPSRLR